jgi:hypothetical protein
MCISSYFCLLNQAAKLCLIPSQVGARSTARAFNPAIGKVRLSLSQMLSSANAFKISDIQEDENEVRLNQQSECNDVTLGWKIAAWSSG